ncbi:MAG: dTDP-4-dehydrorhamnose reductase [Solirubrobacteraceae bacterium]
MRILITGAGGMLGLDVSRAAHDAGHEAISLAHGALDIRDATAVASAVAQAAPDVLINCAAWTDVDGAEAAFERALEVNGAGAGHVAAAGAAAGAFVVHVSSDYVFDGRKRSPYVESDPVAPLSAYGQSKLAGERAVLDAAGADACAVVRSSWLFGAGGRCFPRTIMRLAAERERLEVVSDQFGCPTFTGHLAPALVTIACERRAGVLHVVASDSCSWFQLAVETVALSGAECEVAPIPTDGYPLPAPRPAYSVLASERGAPVLPGWRDGLRAFAAQLAEVAA